MTVAVVWRYSSYSPPENRQPLRLHGVQLGRSTDREERAWRAGRHIVNRGPAKAYTPPAAKVDLVKKPVVLKAVMVQISRPEYLAKIPRYTEDSGPQNSEADVMAHLVNRHKKLVRSWFSCPVCISTPITDWNRFSNHWLKYHCSCLGLIVVLEEVNIAARLSNSVYALF